MAYLPVAGIYEIRNTLNNKVYVGSSINMKKRMQTHKYELVKGVHCSAHLQAAWGKYGVDAFTFRPVLVCSRENLIMYEQIVCDGFQANDRLYGYNKLLFVDSHKGMKFSKERLLLQSMVLPCGPAHHNFGKDWGALGRQVIARTKANCHPLSDEHRLNLSAAKQGKKMPEGFSETMRQTRLGKPMSEETKRRRSEASRNMNFCKAQDIRSAFAAGNKLVTGLAELFGVSKKCVRGVLSGTAWVAPRGT